jgi:type II secretory pathway pseudopilin PulG
MRNWVSGILKGEPGLTMVELLVAVSLTGIIGAGIAMGIGLTLNVTDRNSDHGVSTAQIRNASYWIRQDVRMAQTVQTDAGASGFPLGLAWTEWDGTSHQVTYAVSGSQLTRSHSIDGGAASVLVVAGSVDSDPAATYCQYSGGTLTFEVTTLEGDSSTAESTEVITVKPRSSQ